MNKFSKTALACAISVLLVACGEGTGNQTRNPAFAGTVGSAPGQPTQSATAALTDYYQSVQRIYLAYFGRPADPAGLVYFAGLLQGENAPTAIADLNASLGTNPKIKAIVDVFSTSQESQDLYGGDNSAFIDAVYQSLFSRAPDDAGKAYWVNALNTNAMTRAAAALNIMVAAQGTDIDIINKKAAVGTAFTSALDLAVEQRGYSGLSANATVRALLSQVNLSTDVAAFQANINSTAAQLAQNAPPPATGAYRSSLSGSGNTHLDMHVLDNDEYYAIYGSQKASHFLMTNFINGTGFSGATAFTSSTMKDFGSNPPSGGSVNASYTPGVNMVGAIGTVGGNVNINATSAAIVPVYTYATPTAISELAGTWRMTERGGNLTNVTVTGNTFSGVGASATTTGCTFNGTLEQHASNKNLYNATITYGPAPCAVPNETVNGIAFSYLFNSGATRQLIILGKNAARTAGNFLSGSAATSAGQVSALQSTDLTVGTGEAADANDTVVVHYTGWIYSANATDGKATQFDTSRTIGTPLTFKLGTGVVIQGWDQGLVGMKAGGTRRLVIPASMAYGVFGSGITIPGNSTLVFDVELVSVTKG